MMLEPDASTKVAAAPGGRGGAADPVSPVSPVSPEAPAAALVAGEVLLPGQRLRHEVGSVSAVMRGDGNFVVFRDGDWAPWWQTGTSGYPGASVAVRDDGEVGLWLQGRAVWAAGTAGHPGAFLQLHADGRLVVYDFYRDALWSSPGT